jgi:hypothetical protein
MARTFVSVLSFALFSFHLLPYLFSKCGSVDLMLTSFYEVSVLRIINYAFCLRTAFMYSLPFFIINIECVLCEVGFSLSRTKVKFTLVQAHRGSRCIALLYRH